MSDLAFNEGYPPSGAASDPVRAGLTAEAIRPDRPLRELLPQDGEVTGLLALMLLTDARRPARVSGVGDVWPFRWSRREWAASPAHGSPPR